MRGYNLFEIMGRLVKDPELSYTTGGLGVCKITIAWSKEFTTKEGKEVDNKLFMPATVWGKQGEFIAENGKKGAEVFAVGELHTRQWEDKESGGKRSMIQFNVREIKLLGYKKAKKDGEEAAE
jgi:single-strand DNA-binding protein